MKQKLFLLTIALFSLCINAQVKPAATSTTSSKIKVYTPSTSASASKAKNNTYLWAVKTDLFAFATGEFPVIGELRIAPKFSVEASAGVTYAFWSNSNLFSSTDSNGDSYGYDSSKAAMGSAFRAAIKYYPSSDYDAIEGWSFGIQVFRKTTNRDYLSDSSYNANLVGKQDSKTKTGVSLIIGKQLFQDSNITFESFIGIGMANVSRDYYTQGDYSEILSLYDAKPVNTKETLPNFQLGFRIGFGN